MEVFHWGSGRMLTITAALRESSAQTRKLKGWLTALKLNVNSLGFAVGSREACSPALALASLSSVPSCQTRMGSGGLALEPEGGLETDLQVETIALDERDFAGGSDANVPTSSGRDVGEREENALDAGGDGARVDDDHESPGDDEDGEKGDPALEAGGEPERPRGDGTEHGTGGSEEWLDVVLAIGAGAFVFKLIGVDEEIAANATLDFEETGGASGGQGPESGTENPSVKVEHHAAGEDDGERETQGGGKVKKIVEDDQDEDGSGGEDAPAEQALQNLRPAQGACGLRESGGGEWGGWWSRRKLDLRWKGRAGGLPILTRRGRGSFALRGRR